MLTKGKFVPYLYYVPSPPGYGYAHIGGVYVEAYFDSISRMIGVLNLEAHIREASIRGRRT